jgi:hypothetical protein
LVFGMGSESSIGELEVKERRLLKDDGS